MDPDAGSYGHQMNASLETRTVFISVICGVQYLRLCIGYLQKLFRFRRLSPCAVSRVVHLVAAGAMLVLMHVCCLLILAAQLQHGFRSFLHPELFRASLCRSG